MKRYSARFILYLIFFFGTWSFLILAEGCTASHSTESDKTEQLGVYPNAEQLKAPVLLQNGMVD